MLNFPIAGLGRAVRENNAVENELTVVGLVAEVAAVRHDHRTVGVLLPETLIDPIPDRRSENNVGRFDGVLIILQVTHRVAHVVGVLGNVERLFGRVMGGFPANPVDAGILVGIHIDDGIIALVLQWTRRVDLFNRFGRSEEVLAGTGLVAERPHRHAGMIAVAANHIDVALDGSLLPFRTVGKRSFAVVVAVRLDVRLVHDVDAVDVAEIVEIIVLRIVGVADMVDVRLFHHLDILKLTLTRHIVSVQRIGFVAVYSAKLDFLVVEVVSSVTDFGDEKSDDRGNKLLTVVQNELIAVRLLGAPKLR